MAASKVITRQASPLSRARMNWAAPVILLAALVWTYWPTLVSLNRDWQGDANYSVGQLVPLAALYLVWTDRRRIVSTPVSPCWWGLLMIAAAMGARLLGLVALFESAERYSLVLCILGLVLLVAGWAVFWKVKWILLFLFLMVPLPGRVHNLVTGPLQDLATATAVFCLELIGVSVNSEGHVLVLNGNVQLAVAEACSGLRMLTAFVVVASTLAYVVDRPAWQKSVLVASSVPVAILCNTIRLVVTAVLFMKTSSQIAERFFHDFAGLTMMPLAVLMLIVQLWVMSKLVIPDEPAPAPPARR